MDYIQCWLKYDNVQRWCFLRFMFEVMTSSFYQEDGYDILCQRFIKFRSLSGNIKSLSIYNYVAYVINVLLFKNETVIRKILPCITLMESFATPIKYIEGDEIDYCLNNIDMSNDEELVQFVFSDVVFATMIIYSDEIKFFLCNDSNSSKYSFCASKLPKEKYPSLFNMLESETTEIYNRVTDENNVENMLPLLNQAYLHIFHTYE